MLGLAGNDLFPQNFESYSLHKNDLASAFRQCCQITNFNKFKIDSNLGSTLLHKYGLVVLRQHVMKLQQRHFGVKDSKRRPLSSSNGSILLGLAGYSLHKNDLASAFCQCCQITNFTKFKINSRNLGSTLLHKYGLVVLRQHVMKLQQRHFGVKDSKHRLSFSSNGSILLGLAGNDLFQRQRGKVVHCTRPHDLASAFRQCCKIANFTKFKLNSRNFKSTLLYKYGLVILSPSISSSPSLRNKRVHEQLCSLSSQPAMSSLELVIGLR